MVHVSRVNLFSMLFACGSISFYAHGMVTEEKDTEYVQFKAMRFSSLFFDAGRFDNREGEHTKWYEPLDNNASEFSLNSILLTYRAVESAFHPALFEVNPAMEMVTSAVDDMTTSRVGHQFLFTLPLSIVNMPVKVELASRFEQLEITSMPLAYDASQKRMSLKLAMSMPLTQDWQFDFTLDHVMFRSHELVQAVNIIAEAKAQSLLTAGVAYDWNNFNFSSDINAGVAQDQRHFRFWHLGTRVPLFEAMNIRLGYYYDLNTQGDHIYAFGSEIKLNARFSLDVSGLYSQFHHIQGLLRTSYDF